MMILNDLQTMRYVIDHNGKYTWGLCLGCFDLIHWGHIAHIQWAKKQCDYLIVGITADWAICKGRGRPLMNQDDRMHVVDGIAGVDFVVPSNAKRGTILLEVLKPDYYIKGPDRRRNQKTPGLQEEIKIVKGYGGEVLFSPDDIERHSSAILSPLTQGIDKQELPR